MIIKLQAVIVCDNCDAEVACTVPMEFDKPEWSSRFKRPEIPSGEVITNEYDGFRYLCARCVRGDWGNDYDGGG